VADYVIGPSVTSCDASDSAGSRITESQSRAVQLVVPIDWVSKTSAIVPVEALALKCVLISANNVLGKSRILQIDFVKTEGVC
jgi:hypothetical protein